MQDDDIFSKYDLGEKLGSGGFGQVRDATVKRSGEVRACKVIVKEEMEASSPVNVEEEVEIMTLLHHENCIRLYDVYEDQFMMYIVMEKCCGGELFCKLETDVIIKESTAANICKQMVEAIRYVHSVGVAHRDLKPENFLFADTSAEPPLKLIDFGLSKIVQPHEVLSEPCGTLHYVAPEVLRGAYNVKADMWAVGVIIFLMLYGYYPFDGSSDEQVMRAIVQAEPRWNFARHHVSEAAKDFMRGLLDKDPSKRLSADHALEHRWLADPTASQGATIPKNVVQQARRASVVVQVDDETQAKRDKLLKTEEKHLNQPKGRDRRTSVHMYSNDLQMKKRLDPSSHPQVDSNIVLSAFTV